MRAGTWVTAAVLFLAVLAQAAVWAAARDAQAAWLNVPPVPRSAGALALADPQLAYRATGLMLQNMGDMGGRVTPLKDYDYAALGRWFELSAELDPRAAYVPHLAAYYFGATQDPSQLGPLIDYLARVGAVEAPGAWRWLAQAVYLARYRMGDMARARALAGALSAIAAERGGLPSWARNMEAYVLADMGEKEAATALLLAILAESDGMDPTEVNATVDYLCRELLAGQGHPLCESCL